MNVGDEQERDHCLPRGVSVQELAHLEVDVFSDRQEVSDVGIAVTIETTNLVTLRVRSCKGPVIYDSNENLGDRSSAADALLDADLDNDGDGFSNREEIDAGTGISRARDNPRSRRIPLYLRVHGLG